jgi:hypothetical protein
MLGVGGRLRARPEIELAIAALRPLLHLVFSCVDSVRNWACGEPSIRSTRRSSASVVATPRAWSEVRPR